MSSDNCSRGFAEDEAMVQEGGMMSGPYSAGGSAVRGASFAPPLAARRFVFPAVADSSEPAPKPESPKVAWPEYPDDAISLACKRAADAMLRQLWGKGDDRDNAPGRPTVIAVTSPMDGDGKTSLLLGVAPFLAQQMRSGILIVDANLRKPDLTSHLSVPPGQTPIWPPLIYPTNVPRLNVLPAPAKLSPRNLDRGWLDDLREAWPLVVLDTPSLANANVLRLTCGCDGIYLAVRLGHTTQRAVRRAARIIRGGGGRLLGCIVMG